MKEKTLRFSLTELLSWNIVIISFVSIIALSFGVFKPPYVLLFSGIIFCTFILLLSKKYNLRIKKKSISYYVLITLLILLSLIFCINAKPYIMGGQDEGVYVNMAEYFKNYGKIFVHDDLREEFDNEMKTFYDENNIRFIMSTSDSLYVEDKYEGSVLPGLYLKDLKKSEYVFQFYHLHPIWMALFSYFFGMDNSIFSLFFFSILSIIFFYKIIQNLTNNKVYAFLGSMLLILNPLHVYFSKFPVTEIISLCFMLGAFNYFIDYFKLYKEKNNEDYRFLFISSLMLGCYFFTRITGFMYVPFLYVSIFYISIFVQDQKQKRVYIYYLGGILLLYVLSVAYGYIFSFPYSTDIYRLSFSIAIQSYWKIKLLVVAVFALVLLVLANKSQLLKSLFRRIFQLAIKYGHLLFILVLLYGIYKIISVLFGNPEHNSFGLDYWNIVGQGWAGVRRFSLYLIFMYISPILALFSIYSVVKYDRKNTILNSLVLFLFFFFAYFCALKYFTPYQYYYSRYFISEFIPLLILFNLLVLNEIKRNYIKYTILFLTLSFYLFLSIPQLKVNESNYISNDISELIDTVPKDDLLILNNIIIKNFHLNTTLKFYFDRKVFVSDYGVLGSILKKMPNIGYDDIYLLSDKPIENDFFTLIKKKEVRIGTSNSPANLSVMVSYDIFSKDIYLYHVDVEGFADYDNNGAIYDSNLGLLNGDMDNFISPVWTSEKSYIRNIDARVTNEQVLMIETYGWNPSKEDLEKLDLHIFVEGVELKLINYQNNCFRFEIENIDLIDTLEIRVKTFIPSELGMSSDSRKLGLDIKSIKIVTENFN